TVLASIEIQFNTNMSLIKFLFATSEHGRKKTDRKNRDKNIYKLSLICKQLLPFSAKAFGHYFQ
ncbi:MAG: hypothetical protein NWP82_01355, partial [Flavobacteriales bacterium]|nr:hypothetical protein [Flavobacteriales bacterium]